MLRRRLLLCVGTAATWLLYATQTYVAEAQPTQITCRVSALVHPSASRDSYLVIYAPQGTRYVQVSRLSSAPDLSLVDYAVSPDGKLIALEEGSGDSSQVRIVNVSNAQEIAVVADASFFRQGSIWDNRSNKLLLQDGYRYFNLSMYDVDTKIRRRIPKDEVSPLDTYEAVWSPDDQFIAFVGRERVFPATEYGKNDVAALYIMKSDGSNYQPISDPKESIGRDGDHLIWLSDRRIAFSSCVRETCNINISERDGKGRFTFSGNYILLAKHPLANDLLLLNLGLDRDIIELVKFNPDARQFTKLAQLSRSNLPFSTVWSPDGRYIAYAQLVGSLYYLTVTDVDNLSTKLIEPGLDWLGDWHPSNQRILFSKSDDSKLYVYDIGRKITEMVFDEKIQGRVSAPTWICSK